MSVNVIKVKQELSNLYSSYCDEYRSYAEEARREALSNLKPGQRVPEKIGLYTEEIRGKFSERATNLRTKALQVIDDALLGIEEEKTAPPSQDATNYITLLNTRTDISEGDIDEALRAYGDNYSAYKSIRGIAKNHNLPVMIESDIDRVQTGLNEVKNNVLSLMNTYNTEHRDGTMAGAFDMSLDMSLPSQAWK